MAERHIIDQRVKRFNMEQIISADRETKRLISDIQKSVNEFSLDANSLYFDYDVHVTASESSRFGANLDESSGGYDMSYCH